MIPAFALALVLTQAPDAPTREEAPQPPISQQQQQQQQQPSAEGASTSALPMLTLEEAMAQAEERNYDLKVAQARLDQAKTTSAKVWSAYLPQISVGASYTRNNVEAQITLPTTYIVRDVGAPVGPPFDPANPAFGAPTPYISVPDPAGLITATIQELNQYGAQAQINQAIIAPQLWPAIANAYLAEEVATLNVENARREILFGVAQLYFGAAGLKQAMLVQERQLALTRAHEKDARVRYEAGALPRVALIRAEIDRARAEQDLKRAENSFAAAKVSLATMLDRDTNFDVDVPAPVELPAGGDPEKLIEEAGNRPDLVAAEKNVDLAVGQRTGAWLKFLPTLGVNGVYRLSSVGGFTGEAETWAITLGLNWTIFDGGLREAEIREASARVAEARANRRSLELRAKDELTRAMLDLDSARANAVKAGEQRDLARENMRLVNVGYEAGTATYIEVTDAQTALLSSEIGFVAENLNARLAVLRVLKAAGLFANEDAAQK